MLLNQLMKQLIIITSLLFFICNSANAAIDMYIKILDANGNVIAGTSMYAGHINEIDCVAEGQKSGVCSPTQNCGIATGSFIFTIPLGTCLNYLKNAMYRGLLLNSVEIVFIKAGATPFVFYKIRMENVAVTTHAESIETNGGGFYFQISFDPQKFHWTYTPQTPMGVAGTPVKFGWNKITNTEFFL